MNRIFRIFQVNPKTRLGPLEQQLLQALFDRESATVRELLDDGSIQLAYTTVMTTLDRLYKKNLLIGWPRDALSVTVCVTAFRTFTALPLAKSSEICSPLEVQPRCRFPISSRPSANTTPAPSTNFRLWWNANARNFATRSSN